MMLVKDGAFYKLLKFDSTSSPIAPVPQDSCILVIQLKIGCNLDRK